ncbi:transcriptional regulator [Escherichia coli]|nr:transcriptional regulator [Escherichia coli]
MRAEETGCMDAGSAPTRQADGIRRMNRVATIFPPGAWVAREAVVSLPCTFTGICASEKRLI